MLDSPIRISKKSLGVNETNLRCEGHVQTGCGDLGRHPSLKRTIPSRLCKQIGYLEMSRKCQVVLRLTKLFAQWLDLVTITRIH